MKEIRGSPVDVGRVLGFRVTGLGWFRVVYHHTIYTGVYLYIPEGVGGFLKKSTVDFRGT